jgi:hypothetical protein
VRVAATVVSACILVWHCFPSPEQQSRLQSQLQLCLLLHTTEIGCCSSGEAYVQLRAHLEQWPTGPNQSSPGRHVVCCAGLSSTAQSLKLFQEQLEKWHRCAVVWVVHP